ncbi:alpha/beta hydrolase [Kineosporia succinea]|uniref:Carboxylesterase n=1 Tax=Kineosporia succinea TaxID=84632 RepID=A0ABT9PAC4_9ACTN|nr:alpha/beta fold hydrolase [Kineosporia succinea]MDP9829633.1 carboxylesterase [Kineosporia succinea]
MTSRSAEALSLITGRLAALPLRSRSLRTTLARDLSFAEARAAGERAVRQDEDDPQVEPEYRTRLLTHPGRTGRAVLMLHGYAGSPHSFAHLAGHFHERGYNVYAPREPHHGLRPGSRPLSAAGLVRYADEALDVVAGLGDEVGVIGFSGGGALATWLSAYRPASVRRLLLLAPFFRPHPTQAPRWAVPALTLLFGLGVLPDRPVPGTGYTLHGVAQYLRVMANQPPGRLNPGLLGVGVAYSALDGFIDPAAALAVCERVAAASGVEPQIHRFPPDAGLIHDVVAPEVLLGNRAEVADLYLNLYEA